jgi:hypothetical protein
MIFKLKHGHKAFPKYKKAEMAIGYKFPDLKFSILKLICLQTLMSDHLFFITFYIVLLHLTKRRHTVSYPKSYSDALFQGLKTLEASKNRTNIEFHFPKGKFL